VDHNPETSEVSIGDQTFTLRPMVGSQLLEWTAIQLTMTDAQVLVRVAKDPTERDTMVRTLLAGSYYLCYLATGTSPTVIDETWTEQDRESVTLTQSRLNDDGAARKALGINERVRELVQSKVKTMALPLVVRRQEQAVK